MSSSDRGAVLIQSALVLLVLMAFSAFSIDYGVLWASRRQAQNAADAAVLAGAISLAYDSGDTTSSGPASQSARAVANDHRVWGTTPVVAVNVGTSFPTCPSGEPGPCVRVDVFRDVAHGNALNTFFGTLVGVNSQGVRATATAVASVANATDCLGPFAIADRFADTNSDGLFNGSDFYTPPTATDPGTGYSVTADMGIDLLVKAASNTEQLGPGWFRLLDLGAGPGGGTSSLNEVIRSCTAVIHGIGDDLADDTANGQKAGVKGGIDDLINTDAGADWDPVAKKVINSCVVTSAHCYKYLPDGTGPIVDDSLGFSPRTLAIAVFDPYLYLTTGEIKIVNIFGFFIWKMEGPGNKTIHGVLVTRPGIIDNTKGNVPGTGSFLKQIRIIR
jgi:hypothetical protein